MNIVEFIQASGANYTAGRGGRAIDGMAVHYTATSASAHNNLVYFSRPGAGASAHLFVDKDGAILQSVRLEDTAWAVGDFAENQRTVSVEVVSAGEDFTDAQVAALAEIYAYLRATYGITRVIRHYDVTGKRCPAPYVDAGKWAALRARITGGGFGAAAGGGNGGSAPSGSVAELAQAVIRGDYGNGDARRGALGSRYDEVQAEVNRILGGGTATGGSSSGGAGADIEALAQAVIRGDYGNGDARRAALGASYNAVQARVNEILGAGGSSSGGSGGADIEALAQAVIRGEYGNGDERRRRLGSLYDAVQARVNEILL
ncbi:N-acetylmuramoyl-L-alanine amidase [Collinsella ihumii]|uniref:N-acetylmuramoyl-L-alanine amidase n=1 Tax=Collinsella ihumii TaxID=1720204 RepID=A0AAW7JZI7_9ACTN|nr:N-acetylmuramoyl-L-alanine amidase [Collinsella ihumii]MDN0070143.1 N-acetylmuramoyl-L-alanine amidase [Collinsella ihumii]